MKCGAAQQRIGSGAAAQRFAGEFIAGINRIQYNQGNGINALAGNCAYISYLQETFSPFVRCHAANGEPGKCPACFALALLRRSQEGHSNEYVSSERCYALHCKAYHHDHAIPCCTTSELVQVREDADAIEHLKLF